MRLFNGKKKILIFLPIFFQLSHYLDIIEVHIARQISTKSDAFFQAMSSQDKLQDNMMKTCQSIKQLR